MKIPTEFSTSIFYCYDDFELQIIPSLQLKKKNPRPFYTHLDIIRSKIRTLKKIIKKNVDLQKKYSSP